MRYNIYISKKGKEQMTNLISTSRITTRTECVAPSYAKEIAEAIKITGRNMQPLYVRDIGTPIDPKYVLVQEHHMKQLATLAAVRLLREEDLAKYGMCNVIIVNPLNNMGERVDMEAAILAQL